MPHLFIFLVRSGTVVVLAFLLTTLSQAQSGSTTPVRTGRPDTLQLELGRQLEREMIDQALARPPAPAKRNPGLRLAEFQADFLSLQVVNKNLLNAVSGADPLDLKFIAKSAAEIRKLSQRLKANLALPKGAETTERSQTEVGPVPEKLRSSLLILDRLIFDFVSNPVFVSAKVVDAELSAKARLALDEIIALSGWVSRVTKSSEKGKQRGQKIEVPF